MPSDRGIQVGTEVEVRNRFTGEWSIGFEVVGGGGTGQRCRPRQTASRRSDPSGGFLGGRGPGLRTRNGNALTSYRASSAKRLPPSGVAKRYPLFT